MKISAYQRKGISPIVATVLIIAATLIAFAAVLGYIFGIFGSSSNTANVAVSSVSLSAKSIVNQTTAIILTNSGTAATSFSSVSLTYGGTTCTLSSTVLHVVPTTIAANGKITVAITLTTAGDYCGTTGATASAGEAFNGFVSLTNAAEATFTGTFSS